MRDLPIYDYREALRACKGMALRTETYELELEVDDEMAISIYRIAQEPKRLFPRYLYTNPRFVAAFARQYLAECVRS